MEQAGKLGCRQELALDNADIMRPEDSPADLLERYPLFENAVSDLIIEVTNHHSPARYDLGDCQSFWADGTHPQNIFLLSKSPGFKAWLPSSSTAFYRRQPEEDVYDQQRFQQMLKLGLVLRGLDNVEQVIAASAHSGALVCQHHGGTPVTELELPTIKQITDDQLQKLADTVVAVERRGLRADEVIYAYHIENGFSLSVLPSQQYELLSQTTEPEGFYPLRKLAKEWSADASIRATIKLSDCDSQLFRRYCHHRFGQLD